jgi:hypothetical protein
MGTAPTGPTGASTFPGVRCSKGPKFRRTPGRCNCSIYFSWRDAPLPARTARFHVRATPPTSPLLFEYGSDFPAFIEGYEHAQDMPWLADTARIERAWLDAYHAADVPPLSPDVLAAVPSDRLGDLVFTAHPAARIVRSAYPAVTIFAMNRVEGLITPLRSNTAEDALITRPDMEVAVRLLPPGGLPF